MSKILTVEDYIEQHPYWGEELNELRNLLLTYDLEEGIKWGGPVYMMKGKNLFGLGAFKNHYSIWLFQGGLLIKNTSLLVNAQEGKTQNMRQIKFNKNSVLERGELSPYIEETITNHKKGKIEIPSKKTFQLAEFLKIKLNENPECEKMFQKLSAGKQRDYSEFILQAKREDTRQSRINKILPLILEGKGLNDKYKT